jgi:hypothetical protein
LRSHGDGEFGELSSDQLKEIKVGQGRKAERQRLTLGWTMKMHNNVKLATCIKNALGWYRKTIGTREMVGTKVGWHQNTTSTDASLRTKQPGPWTLEKKGCFFQSSESLALPCDNQHLEPGPLPIFSINHYNSLILGTEG